MKRILLTLLTVIFSLGISAKLTQSNGISKKEQKSNSGISQINPKYFPIGYCYSNVDIAPASGFSKPYQDYEIFAYIKLPASKMKKYVGDKISAINVGFADDLRDITVFVREDINKEDIASKTANVELGWSEVVLDKSVVIEEKDYYIGYRGTIPAGTMSVVRLATSAYENAMIMKDGGKFFDYTTHWANRLTWAIQALVEGDKKHFINDAQMIIPTELNEYQKKNTKINIPFYFKNLGQNEIKKIEVSCFYADKIIKKEYDVNCKAESEFKVDFELQITDVDKVKFKITKINGIDKDILMLDKKLILYNDKDLVPRKVLVERFIIEDSKYVPLSTERLVKLFNKEKLNDKIVSVWHHINQYQDKYTIEDSKELRRFFIYGTFPLAIMLDRTIFKSFSSDIKSPMATIPNPEPLKEYVNGAFAVPCLTTVNINQENPTVSTTNDVKIRVSGQYNGKIPSEDLFVSVYVVEDGLKSDNQLDIGENYIRNYIHDNVIRKMLNGAQGTKIKWNGNKYEVVVEGKLDASWNKENLKVVAFVSKSSKNKLDNTQVLNAEQEKLKVQTGLNSAYAQSLNVFVKNNKVFVKGDYTSLRIFTIDGKQVVNNNLQLGTYLVKVANGNDLAIKKIVVF